MESCVIYARFSSHGQNEQSIEAQVRICKEFAESKGTSAPDDAAFLEIPEERIAEMPFR